MKLINKFATKTSTGVLSKAWYEIDGESYLVKGNTEGNLEPYSEVIASNIFKALGIKCVEYNLIEANKISEVTSFDIPHLSICKDYKTENVEQILSICKFLDIINDKPVRDYWGAYHRSFLDKDFLYKMLIIDAFVGNQDRHLNNWELSIDKDGNIYESPIIDNGASLLFNVKESALSSLGKLSPDKSKPFKDSHTEQVRLIMRNLNGRKLFPKFDKEQLMSQIFLENKEVFNILGLSRSESILGYLSNRFFYIEGVMESV